MASLSASTKALSDSVYFHHQNRSFMRQEPKQLSFSSSSIANPAGFRMTSIAFESKERSLVVKTSAVRHLEGSVTKTEGLRFAVVVARFNEIITKPLLEGAISTFKKYSVKEEDIDVVWVPGCFEIGVVAEKLGKSRKYQAVLCIGAVIRGDTTHYDAVANSAASGVLSAGLNSGVPCIFGVLTCDNMDQAINRAGGKSGNKGAEAALTAVVWVPSSLNLGIVADRLGKSRKYHAVLCIGAVIRGETTHYDAVADSATSGVLSAGLNSGVPCIFGVLTCENMEQAINRAGGKSGNKGAEAALSAIEMASLFEHHLK